MRRPCRVKEDLSGSHQRPRGRRFKLTATGCFSASVEFLKLSQHLELAFKAKGPARQECLPIDWTPG